MNNNKSKVQANFNISTVAKRLCFMSYAFMFLVLFVTVFSSSCSKHNNSSNAKHPVNIFTTVAGSVKKSISSDNIYSPAVGEKLFLFYNSVGNSVSQQKTLFTYDITGNWIASPIIYWDDLPFVSPANIYSFFAFAPSVPVVSPSVSIDQRKLSDYIATDLLVAYSTATDETLSLPLNFKHVLSQVLVNLSTSDVAGVNISSATLDIIGVKKSYSLDYKNPSNEAPTIVVVDDLSESLISVVPFKIADGKFKAVLPAQSFAIGDLTMKFQISGKEYTWSNTNIITTEAGKKSTISLKISLTDIEMIGDDIKLTDWDTSGETIGSGVQL